MKPHHAILLGFAIGIGITALVRVAGMDTTRLLPAVFLTLKS